VFERTTQQNYECDASSVNSKDDLSGNPNMSGKTVSIM